MADEPAREIEVEVLPPGEIPGARGPRPNRDEEGRVYSQTRVDPPPGAAAAPPEPSFEDPFIALVARLMDSAFVIPGTNIRFGLDPLIGLLPGIGDGTTALTSLLLLIKSAAHVPRIVLAHMALNIVMNTTLGAVPGFGDAFSFWFKSNERNYALLRKHAASPGTSTRGDWLFILGILAIVGGIMAATIVVYANVITIIVRFFLTLSPPAP
jgi:hypothetical protein